MWETYLGWLDIKSVVFTVIIIPVLLVARRLASDAVKRIATYLFEGILYALSVSIIRSLAARLSLKKYCRQLLNSEKLKYLHIPSGKGIKVNIDDVFIPLSVEGCGSDKLSISYGEILKLGNRIRVVGDPGSGKSSLVKRLFRDCSLACLSKPAKQKLPVLLELRGLDEIGRVDDASLGEWLYGKVREEVASCSSYKMDECFDAYVNSNGILLFLDGLDEVASATYKKVQAAINELSDMLARLSENNTVLITMRVQFHDQIHEEFRDDFPHIALLKPFSPSDIYEFLSRWKYASNPHGNISRIYSDLTDRPTLREMCGNPLVLSMYVASDQEQHHNIAPETRTEFYKAVAEELIIKRRLHQKDGNITAYGKLREQRERILGALSFEHLLAPDQSPNSLSWDKAIKIIKDVVGFEDSKAEAYLQDLIKETGIIEEERPHESLRFIHLTFCEFLAANEAVQGRENGWDELINAHRQLISSDLKSSKTRLVETIPFACGLLPRVRRTEAIRTISALSDLKLLARCFLETKAYEMPEWDMFESNFEDELQKVPESEWNTEWLRALHLYNVVVQDMERSCEHINKEVTGKGFADFFKALIGKKKANIFKLLDTLASQDAAAAFRISKSCSIDIKKDYPQVIVKNCDQAPLIGFIVQEMQNGFDVKEWVRLLSEAALQSKVVNKMLQDMAPLNELDALLHAVKKDQFANKTYVKKPSFLRQCLSISMNLEAKEGFPALGVVQKIRGCSS